ncbi:unnamed protein product [Protopolystoma xenopodis]|uniref:Uncharacterized protein n=1 Tax=Protopolystoma xenopodis TaxID=117903 RepID=A0A448X9N9_9PLAT|nr:unnamed protein product [Protopolystoma xenopodis]
MNEKCEYEDPQNKSLMSQNVSSISLNSSAIRQIHYRLKQKMRILILMLRKTSGYMQTCHEMLSLTVISSADVLLDRGYEDWSQPFHLFDATSEETGMGLVYQLLLPIVHFFNHLAHAGSQVLSAKAGQKTTNITIQNGTNDQIMK